MNLSNSRLAPAALTAAATAAVLLTVPWSVAQAQPGIGAACSPQISRVTGALLGGRKPDSTQMESLEGCLLAQPAIAESLERPAQVNSTTAPSTQAEPTVLANYQDFGFAVCNSFMSDGTLRSAFFPAAFFSGGYLGIPGIFTVYSWSAGVSGATPAFSAFGLTIGPFSAELLTAVDAVGTPHSAIFFGLQVPNCVPLP
jgi:hypothetical protein